MLNLVICKFPGTLYNVEITRRGENMRRCRIVTATALSVTLYSAVTRKSDG